MARSRVLSLATLLLLGHAALCHAQAEAPAERSPVPKFAEQKVAEQRIRRKYKADYAQNDAASQVELARKLREEARQPTDDAALRFVLLREARELAVDGGDLDLAFGAVDDLDHAFVIDSRNMKFSAMTEAIDKSQLPPGELVESYIRISARQLAVGDIEFASKATVLAGLVAQQARDRGLKQRVAEEEAAVKNERRAQNAVRAALVKLRAHPEDAEANFTVGRYFCFVFGRWPQGLPYLAKGSDEKLRALAARELAAPSDAVGMAALGDDWWDYGAIETGGAVSRLHHHAADWYAKALPGLSRQRKSLAQERIQAVQE